MIAAPHGTRGFTLLELLVVIAIIGLLSAVVLATMGTSRSKGIDANIRANLKNATSQAQLFYDLANPNSYDGVCSTVVSTAAGRQVAGAERTYNNTVTSYADGTASTWNTAQCHDSDTAWVATVPLSASRSSGVVAWCVDSTGAAKQITSVLAANAMVCP